MENLHDLIPFPLSLTSKVFGVLPWGSFKNLSGKFSSIYSGILLLIFCSSIIFLTVKCLSSDDKNPKSLSEIGKLWIEYMMLVYPTIRIVNSIPSFFISLLCMERFYTKIFYFIRMNDTIMGNAAHTNILSRKQFWFGLTIYLMVAIAIFPFKAVMILKTSKKLFKSSNMSTLLLFPISFFGNVAVVCVEMQFACICRAINVRLALMNSRLTNVVDQVRTKRLSFLLDVPSSQFVKNELSLKKGSITKLYSSKREKVKSMWEKLKSNRKTVTDLCKVSPILIQCGHKTNNCVEEHELLKELTLLRLCYRHLHLSLINVQELFGIHLLCSFCSLFTMIVFFIYFEFYHNKSYKINISNFIYLICGWLLHFTVRFNLLLWQANKTSQEAEKTNKIIPLVMGRQLDQSIKDELEMFSIEVSCSDWKLTGWNFFVLKPELFVWTIGGVVTYVGIIVNFDGNSSS